MAAESNGVRRAAQTEAARRASYGRMPRLVSALLAILLTVPCVAVADGPRVTFAADVTYQCCVQTWAHACGMRDPEGRVFGRAILVQHCTRYRFTTDGRLRLESMPGLTEANGRYTISGEDVRIELLDANGDVARRETLRLSDGGAALGDLRRFDPTP